MDKYIAIIAAVVAFFITFVLGYAVIPYLRKLKFGQTLLDIGPNWHKEKQGTPTMGGVMLVVGVIAALVVAFSCSALSQGTFFLELKNKAYFTRLIAGLGMALCMCGIGFIDDYVKVVKKRNLGLTAKARAIQIRCLCPPENWWG